MKIRLKDRERMKTSIARNATCQRTELTYKETKPTNLNKMSGYSIKPHFQPEIPDFLASTTKN